MKEKICSQKGCCCDKIIIQISNIPTEDERIWWETRGCTVKDNYVLIPFSCPNLMGRGGEGKIRKCFIYDKRPLICRMYPSTEQSKEKLKAFGIECSLI